ncbi:glycosyltransferase [Dehalobacter sp. DCM]|uniref:glycosyltransferase n=1 Tax=Dehalobacter sp. DCM TaxID=2907827 RepID=UPI0030820A46|nr:glycosyltransferase [Dehalobacter sp. DCM]
MTPPFITYSTFHRLGLNVRNLNALLLNTTDDFELHIIDSNSQDGTWDFIKSLSDSRIKSITRLPMNYGPIYALNYNLARRKPDQYFIVLESDVYHYVPDWISRFMKVFDMFPDVGLLGLARSHPYPVYYPEVSLQEKNGVQYLQLMHTEVGNVMDFVPGQCQFLRPELIDLIGYWSEENGYGDAELSLRVTKYTPFKAGYVIDVPIDMIQSVPCESCEGRPWCQLDKVNTTCFNIWKSKHRNESFVLTNGTRKYLECFDELRQGKRTVYCASIHDPDSYKNHLYHMDWALENFDYYANNSN